MAFLKSLYLNRRFYLVLAGCVVLFLGGYVAPVLVGVAQVGLLALLGLTLLDGLMLYRVPRGVRARRDTPVRLSNGDENEIRIHVASAYPFPVRATILEEVPFIFQRRDASCRLTVSPGQERIVRYTVRPLERGAYSFGAVNAYIASPLRLIERRYRFEEGREVPVYPSFLQMRKYTLLAVSNRLEEVGVKKMRRVGHTMEFDHVRDYVLGDDPRTINWKATARRAGLMVNQYRDERAQPIYCVLDAGRVMKMPFDGMTLLDYSINASLVLANIALLKQDRAGLVTFSHTIGTVVRAERKAGQIYKMQEALYRLDTDFMESDYARLAAHLRRHLRQRSLIVLFTNFMTRPSMQRQVPYLRALAQQHIVVAVFFENTALRTLLDATPRETEGIYVKTMAEKFSFEKRAIVEELRRHGIQAILTPPRQLSVNVINKYLELKARGAI